MGTGTSSATVVRNTVLMPYDATLTTLVFDIRDQAIVAGQRAEIIVTTSAAPNTPIPTGIIAIITTDRCAIDTGSYFVNQCDRVTVRITTNGGAFMSGSNATVLYTPS